MTHDLLSIPHNATYSRLGKDVQAFLQDENLTVPHITFESTVQAKNAQIIVDQMQADSQAMKERRQETRQAANTLLTTLEELQLSQHPVQQAAAQISQIQQDVLDSANTLERTKSGML
ncbi:hypothetical protein Unana1_06797 [Umbelopsis nana]